MKSNHSYRTSRSDVSRFSHYRNQSSYMYGSTAPAYAPEQELDFDVIPGRRTQPEVVELPASIMTIARTVVMVALVVAVIACIRVGLSAMSVSTAIATSDLSEQIELARTTGNNLEVVQSQLSNSTHIKLEATSLGMAAAEQTSVITLSADVVATDDQGNLSLSGSISAIENAE